MLPLCTQRWKYLHLSLYFHQTRVQLYESVQGPSEDRTRISGFRKAEGTLFPSSESCVLWDHATLVGVEPTISGWHHLKTCFQIEVPRDIQFRHRACPRGGLNTRSPAYKTNALPLSYWGASTSTTRIFFKPIYRFDHCKK